MPFDATTQQLMPAPVLEAVMDIAYNWMMFGTFLGIPYDKLQAIGEPTNAGTCMLATLNEWITFKPQEATILNLICAVGGSLIGNMPLVQRIKEIYGFR